jgi:hypothetical protein
MQITFQNNTGADFETGTITFGPTGQVEAASPIGFYNNINNVLAPTISTLQNFANLANVTNFNFWELMNWMFVSQYWLILLDFGQIAPSTFQYDDEGNLLSYGPVIYPAENNIFVNETLFNQYNSYLRSTILPLYGYTLAEFLPLNDTNRLQATTAVTTTTLKYLYTCSDLKLRAPLSLIISVIVADWGLIHPSLTIIIFLFGLWKLRGIQYGIPTFKEILIIVNECHCMESREGMDNSTQTKVAIKTMSSSD